MPTGEKSLVETYFWETLPTAIKEAGFYSACVGCRLSLLCMIKHVVVVIHDGKPVGLKIDSIVVDHTEEIPSGCPIGQVESI